MSKINYNMGTRQSTSYQDMSYPAGYSAPKIKHTHQSAAKSESMRRAAIRREAIKSDNLKEPLVSCPVCKIKLGLDTEECPNCGTAMKKKMDENKRTVLLLIIALIIFLMPFINKAENNDYGDTDYSIFTQIEEFFNYIIEEEIY